MDEFSMNDLFSRVELENKSFTVLPYIQFMEHFIQFWQCKLHNIHKLSFKIRTNEKGQKSSNTCSKLVESKR